MSSKPKSGKRPRSTTRRTLPPDAASLEAMVRAATRVIPEIGTQFVKSGGHDLRARHHLLMRWQERAAAFAALARLDPERARWLMAELGLNYSTPKEET
ncbi:MAG: hypothetical protein UY92_C0006G0001 [Candidatus Magasanikbacteria bacterium GW2011_GWA2_56_11]|uniref:Uncharacterized protein n=1 Tax=Candidatus Magasanikbacteria bacterium GW2011_GWA2_56_11 TaxID=1619044 RepID=A0A0G1YGT8_9BACT|nr:MAG: hypothetical protein UY92_C0006G0001 [Candidatus Magasanikbacteria bacterium GW2011_GWA2_56_11]